MALFASKTPRRGTSAAGSDAGAISDAVVERVTHAHLELIPTPKAHLQFEHLPSGSVVSVTASPAKELQATLDMAAQLLDLGHAVIPHLAARMVESPQHVAAIARWIRDHGVTDAFVIGGDAPEPFGPYLDAGSFMRDLLEAGSGLTRIGFGGYPDGHASIPDAALAAGIIDKRDLLAAAGVDGWISTQMCFDTTVVTRWIEQLRLTGVDLPIHLGVPGVIDTMKLLTMGTKLGVGASLRYLRKNRAVVSKLAAPGGYDPMDMLTPMAADLDRLDIAALHMFTFNQVANTVAWQLAVGGVASSAATGLS